MAAAGKIPARGFARRWVTNNNAIEVSIMNCNLRPGMVIRLLSVTLPLLYCGCSSEQTSEVVEQVEHSAEETAQAVQRDASKAVEKTEEFAAELGEKAMAYLGPLKKKFGDLDDLKGKPEELKAAVTDLIASIEQRAESLKLPEKVHVALTAAREKLVALKTYLEGEVEEAKVEQHIQEITETVKSHLGL